MALGGLLKTSRSFSSQASASQPKQAAATPEAKPGTSSRTPSFNNDSASYIVDASELNSDEAEAPDLRDLNNCLEALAAIFPDVQVEVFREMLQNFDEESRLAVVTEELLKQKAKWVRGRYRMVSKDKTQSKLAFFKATQIEKCDQVPREERFRSPGYKKAVRSTTYHEFKGLPKSTINAVLAEFNHSYLHARPTLVALSSKSWRFSISSLFLRRKHTTSLDAEHHPLVIWQSTGQGSIVPSLKSTGSDELDAELFTTLVKPLQQKIITERVEKDRTLAIELNTQEAEENGALHDCECCYTSTTFEELAACDDGGHFLCFNCVRHAVKESVFGQGWQRNIDTSSGSLRCLAPSDDECAGCISQSLIRRALSSEEGGDDMIRKLDERLVEDSLLKTGLPLIRCPFCSYAEIDELYLPTSEKAWRFKTHGVLSFYTCSLALACFGMMPFALPIFAIISLLFLLFCTRLTFGCWATQQFEASLMRLRRKRHGLRFQCQNPSCQRPSCLNCSKGWSDIHICHESSLLALRTQVELAMSLAIKRTCPRCNTSFVKSSGCNKLTCVCGYQMCYVCRKDIGNGEGYRHFCEHFRPNGGRGCTECDKCDLYRCEDDEVVVKKAKEEAEKQWMEKEGEGTSKGDEKLKKVLKKRYEGGGWWGWARYPDWERVLDGVLEAVIEP